MTGPWHLSSPGSRALRQTYSPRHSRSPARRIVKGMRSAGVRARTAARLETKQAGTTPMRRLQIALVAACMFSGQAALLAEEPNLCERELVRAAATHDVPLSMLYAGGLFALRRGGRAAP